MAALALLGTEESISKYLPYAEVRYGYKLAESEIRNQDTVIFRGGYFLYYNKVWDKIQARNITISIPLELRLIERKAFDEQSIREGFNNAVVHRDYLLQESTFIWQYPTKIIIKSPGGFPEGITIENIINESKPRNKLIADILFKCELVEQFGNGVNLMYRNQLSLGKNIPDYTHSTDGRVVLELDGAIQDIEFAKYVFLVAEKKKKLLDEIELLILDKIRRGQTVYRDNTTRELLGLGLIEQIGQRKFILSKQYYLDTNQKGRYTKIKGLSKSQNKELILEHLRNFKSGQKQDFMQMFNYRLNDDQLWTLLRELKSEGKIIFEGKPKSHSGVWKLNETVQKS